MALSESLDTILVLGLGNTLLSDDGVGMHVLKSLEDEGSRQTQVSYCHGGTLGLSLLPEIEDASALIVIDAAEIDAAPGTLRVFEGGDMDRQLGGKKYSAHEVALADLISSASLMGKKPQRRALVATQPADTSWGLEPTPKITAAMPVACREVNSLIERWTR